MIDTPGEDSPLAVTMASWLRILIAAFRKGIWLFCASMSSFVKKRGITWVSILDSNSTLYKHTVLKRGISILSIVLGTQTPFVDGAIIIVIQNTGLKFPQSPFSL